jgi:hypothetical protein
MSLCHAFAGPCGGLPGGLSVANRALQQHHGGVILRHARDPAQFQPSAARRQGARTRWQIAPEQQVVLFLGTPRRHKGLLETAQALSSLRSSRSEAERLLDDPAADQAMARALNPYGDGQAASRIRAALRQRTRPC